MTIVHWADFGNGKVLMESGEEELGPPRVPSLFQAISHYIQEGPRDSQHLMIMVSIYDAISDNANYKVALFCTYLRI